MANSLLLPLGHSSPSNTPRSIPHEAATLLLLLFIDHTSGAFCINVRYLRISRAPKLNPPSSTPFRLPACCVRHLAPCSRHANEFGPPGSPLSTKCLSWTDHRIFRTWRWQEGREATMSSQETR